VLAARICHRWPKKSPAASESFNSIHNVGILLDEMVDRRDIALRAGVGLGRGVHGHKAENSGEENVGDHSALPAYSKAFEAM
jgi:hypothetical protein